MALGEHLKWASARDFSSYLNRDCSDDRIFGSLSRPFCFHVTEIEWNLARSILNLFYDKLEKHDKAEKILLGIANQREE